MDREGVDTGGAIPDYKLGSNDCWCVTAGEIRRSLAAIDGDENARRSPDEPYWSEVRTFWPDWLRWLERAAEHDGFIVG